jgi:hypothetical protein
MLKRFLCSLAVAGTALSFTGANAGTITIGLQEDGGGITTVAGPSAGAAGTAGFIVFGDFSVNASGSISPPANILGQTLDISSANGGHTLTVYISAQDITLPGLWSFNSGFTENLIVGHMTVNLQSYFDANNGLFSTANALGPVGGANFTGPQLSAQSVNSQSGTFNISAPFSITEVFTITADAASESSSSTIGVQAVPGPIVGAGLPGLLAACGGLIALARRRRRQAA